MIDIEELLRQRAGQRQPYMPQDDNEPQYANPGPKLRDPIAPAPVPLPPQRGMGPGGFLGIGLSPGPQIGAYPMPPAAPPAPQEDLLGDNGPAKNLGLGQRDALDSLRFGMPGQAIDPMAAAKNLNLAPAPDDRQAAIAAALKGGDGQGFKYVPTGADLAQAKPQAFQTPSGQTVEKLPTPSVDQVMGQTGFAPAQSGFTRNISDPSGITSQENWSVDPNTQSGYRMTGNRQVAPTMTDYRQSFLNDLAKEGMQAGQAETGQAGVPGMAQLTRQMFGVDMSSPSITPAMRQQLLGMQNHLVDQQQNQGLAREHMANTLANTELQNQGLKERLLLGLKGPSTDTTQKLLQKRQDDIDHYVQGLRIAKSNSGGTWTDFDQAKAIQGAEQIYGKSTIGIGNESLDNSIGKGIVKTIPAGQQPSSAVQPQGGPTPASQPVQPAAPQSPTATAPAGPQATAEPLQRFLENKPLSSGLDTVLQQAKELNDKFKAAELTDDKAGQANAQAAMADAFLRLNSLGASTPAEHKFIMDQLLSNGVSPDFLKQSAGMGLMRYAGLATRRAGPNDPGLVKGQNLLSGGVGMLDKLATGLRSAVGLEGGLPGLSKAQSELERIRGLTFPGGYEADLGSDTFAYPTLTTPHETRRFFNEYAKPAREFVTSGRYADKKQSMTERQMADFMKSLYEAAWSATPKLKGY